MKLYAVGIDIGGTKIAAGVLDRDMNILSICVTKEHAGQSPVQVVDAVERAYWAALEEAQVSPDLLAGVGQPALGPWLWRCRPWARPRGSSSADPSSGWRRAAFVRDLSSLQRPTQARAG